MPSDNEIKTKDGKKIGLSCFMPEKITGGVIIIAPTGGLAKEYYTSFARFFQEQGYVVITFDYRGMGSSAPAQLKKFEANMHQWAVQDINAVILFARNNFPNREIIYTGHSIGGEIIGLAQASQYINKLVLVNSALSCKRLWSVKYRLRITATKVAIRALNKWFGFFPGKYIGFAGNMPKGVMQEWVSWCSNANGLFDAFPDNNYRKLQVPLLSFSFSDDWRCPPKAVQELLNHFANAVITRCRLKPQDIGMKKISHTDFFNPAMKTTLWKILLDWLNNEDYKKPGKPLNDH